MLIFHSWIYFHCKVEKWQFRARFHRIISTVTRNEAAANKAQPTNNAVSAYHHKTPCRHFLLNSGGMSTWNWLTIQFSIWPSTALYGRSRFDRMFQLFPDGERIHPDAAVLGLLIGELDTRTTGRHLSASSSFPVIKSTGLTTTWKYEQSRLGFDFLINTCFSARLGKEEHWLSP